MAQPSYYSDGTTPNRQDTRYRIWTKILGEIQNGLGASANAANNPSRNDTLWSLKRKINKALNGS